MQTMFHSVGAQTTRTGAGVVMLPSSDAMKAFTSVDVALQLAPHTSYSHQKNVPEERVRETGGFVQNFSAEVASSCRHQSKRNELSSSTNQVVESERLVKYRRHPSLLMLLQGQMCPKMFLGGLAFAFPN